MNRFIENIVQLKLTNKRFGNTFFFYFSVVQDQYKKSLKLISKKKKTVNHMQYNNTYVVRKPNCR